MWKNSRSFGASAHPFSRVFYHNSSLDVLSEPDDSYPIREPKKTGRVKNTTGPSESIEGFFNKHPAPAAVPEEDIVMNEGAASAESTNE